MKKVSSINVTLEHLSLKTISKKLKKEKDIFDFFNGFRIQNIDDVAIMLY